MQRLATGKLKHRVGRWRRRCRHHAVRGSCFVRRESRTIGRVLVKCAAYTVQLFKFTFF